MTTGDVVVDERSGGEGGDRQSLGLVDVLLSVLERNKNINFECDISNRGSNFRVRYFLWCKALVPSGVKNLVDRSKSSCFQPNFVIGFDTKSSCFQCTKLRVFELSPSRFS